MSYETKDSGKRQKFETAAQRDTQEGKGYYDCLPFHAIKRLSLLLERGAVKYDKNNWRKGIPMSRFLSSALRHLMQYAEGQRDGDHAIAAIWNMCGIIETEVMIQRGLLPFSLNDIPSFYNGNCDYAYIMTEDHSTVFTIDREDLDRLAAHSWSLDENGFPYTLVNNVKKHLISTIFRKDTDFSYSFKDKNRLNLRKNNIDICE